MANDNKPEAVWPGLEAGVPKPLMPYSPAIKAGEWVFIAGQIASDFETGLAPEVIQANPFARNELELQARYVLTNLANTIKATGLDITRDMARIWQWFVADDPTPQAFEAGNNWPAIGIEPYLGVRESIVGGQIPPSSCLGVRELLCLGTKLEVDMICFNDGATSKLVAAPDDVGTAPGGHAAALTHGDWVFLAAQSAVDWDKNSVAKVAQVSANLWFGDCVERQTDHVLEKLSKVAAAAGSSLEQAVKADVYIGHPQDFAAMDRAWARWFPNNPPARVVIPYMGMGA